MDQNFKRRPGCRDHHVPLLQDIFDHALDRGHQRDAILRKDGDYEAFERILNEGLQKFPVD